MMGGVLLKYLIVQVLSLWLCNTNSSKHLVTTLPLTFLFFITLIRHFRGLRSVILQQGEGNNVGNNFELPSPVGNSLTTIQVQH